MGLRPRHRPNTGPRQCGRRGSGAFQGKNEKARRKLRAASGQGGALFVAQAGDVHRQILIARQIGQRETVAQGVG